MIFCDMERVLRVKGKGAAVHIIGINCTAAIEEGVHARPFPLCTRNVFLGHVEFPLLESPRIPIGGAAEDFEAQWLESFVHDARGHLPVPCHEFGIERIAGRKAVCRDGWQPWIEGVDHEQRCTRRGPAFRHHVTRPFETARVVPNLGHGKAFHLRVHARVVFLVRRARARRGTIGG